MSLLLSIESLIGMAAFLGGIQFLHAYWASPTGIQVEFAHAYTDRYVQLYAGRSRIGTTRSLEERQIVATLKPSRWPQHLTLLAVLVEDRDTDYGARLPRRPFNRVKLAFSVAGWDDARSIEISSGTAPGDAVDPANVLERVPFSIDGDFEFLTEPLEGSGTWHFAAAGLDDTRPGGNRGTELLFAADVIATPPDVLLGDDGSRLAVTVETGVATVNFQYD